MTDMEAWFERARGADMLEVATRFGAKLKKTGAEHVGACPLGCARTDGFAINVKDRVFVCRPSGAGGDIVSMTAHILGMDAKRDFIPVCEAILQEAPPRGESRQVERDPAIERERREERRDAEMVEARKEETKLAEHIRKATAMFETGVPIEGTIAQDYFEDWRKLDLLRCDTRNLRFRDNLGYWDGEKEIGQFPCILEAARDLSGNITGIKRVYLDSSGRKLPKSAVNGGPAKKGTFTMMGSLVYLDEPGELLALAEGVETALAHKMLACVGTFGEQFAGETIAAADSLGNMASDDLMLPACVKRLILIGDSDSNPKSTRQALLKAASRFEAMGLEVFVHMAPQGADWADVVMQISTREAA